MNRNLSVKINVISREEWGALPGKPMETMSLPATHVLFSAENEFKYCDNKEECTQTVRDIQKHYMGKGMEDVPYSFLIGNDGNVYEGRGWNYKPGPDIQKDPKFRDNPTVDIAVICGHTEVTPTNMDKVRATFTAAENFVKFAIQEKRVIDTYEFEGFSDDVKAPDEPTEAQQLEASFEDFAVAHPEWFPIMSKEILAKREKNQLPKPTA